MTKQPIARVQIGQNWYTFKSLISVRKFLCDAMLDSSDVIEKYFTLTSCVQVYNVRNVSIRVISKNGI